MSQQDDRQRMYWDELARSPEELIHLRVLEAMVHGWEPLPSEAAWELASVMARQIADGSPIDDVETHRRFYASLAEDAELAGAIRDIVVALSAPDVEPEEAIVADLLARAEYVPFDDEAITVSATERPMLVTRLLEYRAAGELRQLFRSIRTRLADDVNALFSPYGPMAVPGVMMGNQRGAAESATSEDDAELPPIVVGNVEVHPVVLDAEEQVQLTFRLIDMSREAIVQVLHGTNDREQFERMSKSDDLLADIDLTPIEPEYRVSIAIDDLARYGQIRVIEAASDEAG